MSKHGSTPHSFRIALQNELLERCKKNKGYSLRSFARSLKLSPSSLSRILRGERVPSSKMQLQLITRLGMNPVDVRLDQVESKKKTNLLKYETLSLDTFTMISEWYHYAILELLLVDDFKSDARWVAKKLGITASEVHAAVQRLQRLGILEISAVGKWISKTGGHTNDSKVGASAFKNLQRQILQQALNALDEVPFEERDQTSMTVAINQSSLQEASEMITRFRRELTVFLEREKSRDSVYQLCVSFFPVTKNFSKESV